MGFAGILKENRNPKIMNCNYQVNWMRSIEMSLKKSIKEFATHLGDKESLLDTNYKRVAEMIQLHWGYKEFYQYISKLLVVERDKGRQGFPLEVLKEIYMLQEIHQKEFPNLKPLMGDSLASSRARNNSTMLI